VKRQEKVGNVFEAKNRDKAGVEAFFLVSVLFRKYYYYLHLNQIAVDPG
jgi:hypothetical protein